MNPRVALDDNGEVLIHMSDGGGGDYATFCGLDGDDPAIGLQEVDLPPRRRIDCPTCRRMWLHAKGYRRADFTERDRS